MVLTLDGLEILFFWSLSVFLRQAKCHIEAPPAYLWNDLYSEASSDVFWTLFHTNKCLTQETAQVTWETKAYRNVLQNTSCKSKINK